jgi:ketosteroid isomerase-like protein
MRCRLLLACLALAICASLGPTQEQPGAKLVVLCTATLKALQSTDAAPLAELLSFQASSLLVVFDDELVRSGRADLKERDTWAKKAPLSASARLTEVETTEYADADFVRAGIEDGDSAHILDGVAVFERGETRWLMLALAPRPRDHAQSEDAPAEVLQQLGAWRDAAATGDVEQTMGRLAPDSLCFAVAGPDGVFYVVARPEEVRAFLEGQATAMGPISLTPTGTPQAEVAGTVAIARLRWDVTVAGFEPMPMNLRIHAYRDDNGWRIAGLCAQRAHGAP